VGAGQVSTNIGRKHHLGIWGGSLVDFRLDPPGHIPIVVGGTRNLGLVFHQYDFLTRFKVPRLVTTRFKVPHLIITRFEGPHLIATQFRFCRLFITFGIAMIPALLIVSCVGALVTQVLGGTSRSTDSSKAAQYKVLNSLTGYP